MQVLHLVSIVVSFR